jgi:putative ABC transport system permease protein
MTRSYFSLLDLRLGIRMLTRYPVLTLIGMCSLAFAIAIGAAVFAFISLMLWPRMPLPEGDRLIVVRHHDEAANHPESRVTADFLRWRGGTGTLTDFAAGRGMGRNLQMGDGIVESISVAEVTASMFPMARVGPIMGRALTDDDARAGAPPVMVIGERIWRERYAADPAIVGKSFLLSDAPTTVVGVMPAEFRFPSVYQVWQPLKIDEAAAMPRAGMGIAIWARLRPGVTRAQANSELSSLGARAAADWPATHAHLKATVASPAVSSFSEPRERATLASFNLGAGLLVLLVSGNVALLMFARAATRESEILVRTALGASRARLIAQFFAEALVLSTLAAAIGLAVAELGMAWGVNTFTLAANDGKLLPFWITPRLPPISIAYGIGLALCAAAVTGVLPALKMTRGLSARLRETGAGGGLKFGGVWTLLIVSQIAVTVAVPAVMFLIQINVWRIERQQIGVPPAQYLMAKLQRESDMTQARFEAAVRRVRVDIGATPGVTRVTIADKLPLMWNGFYRIEVDEGGAAPPTDADRRGYHISTAAVEPDFFETFEAPPIAGRLLTPSDYSGVPHVVVVNQPFVDMVLGGRNAVGRRIRYVVAGYDGQRPPLAAEEPWLEIVGVVRHLGMNVPPAPNVAGAYIPLSLRRVDAVHIAARVSGDMTAATNALRSIATKADPTLRIADVQPLDRVTAPMAKTLEYVARLFGVVDLAALVLALSGIYAVMSFAVSRRTREIGIRVALGSQPWRVMLTILRRPLIQLAAGIVFGAMLAFLISSADGITVGLGFGIVGYAFIMLGVCLLACLVPARRVLQVDPIAALRAE